MMVKKIDFHKLGMEIALGKKGTRWMIVDEGGLKEAKEAEGDNKFDKFVNWAEGWKETEQWEYEVGQYMTNPAKNPDLRVEEENDYVLGYAEGMLQREKQLKKKLKEVI